MTTEDQKEKATRVPCNYESIEKGALSLEFHERVELRKKLSDSIDDELKSLEVQLEKAKAIVNGQ
jgi:hypothetical protein